MKPGLRLDRTWITLAFIGATLVVAWPLFLPWIYETHDGHYALYNAAQFDLALRDGQFPVRWLPDLFGGRGLPVFLYYHPLSFYLISLLNVTGIGYIAGVKAVYVLSLVLSGLAMYAWLEDELPREACAVAAVAYVLAPIHVVEIHVKGDPPAALAYVFLPLVLLSIRRIAVAGSGARGLAALALTSAGLVLSHSVTALIALPALLLYAVMTALGPGARSRQPALLRIAAGGALGALISAFQWMPALAERDLVHVDSPLGILFFDFHEHFVALWQWLSPLWGYHGSFPGASDDMSLQIGPVHALAVAAACLAWKRIRGTLAAWALAACAISLLLTLDLSLPVWEAIGPLRYVQFPWRMLVVAALASSALAGVAVARLPGRWVLASAASAPALVTLIFAVKDANRWYWATGAFYALAGLAAWAVFKLAPRGDRLVSPLLCALLATTAAPWTAVPLHSAWRGEPAVVPIHASDLSPSRVRLGVRRTTARDDYLPRTVTRNLARDPGQEFLPPQGSRPDPDVAIVSGDLTVEEIARSSGRFRLSYLAGTPSRAVLRLHDFPGWKAVLRNPRTSQETPLPHLIDEEGRIVVDLPAGRGAMDLRLTRTWPRLVGDLLSLAGFALLAAALVRPWPGSFKNH